MRNTFLFATVLSFVVGFSAYAEDLTLSAVSVSSNTPGAEEGWYTADDSVLITIDEYTGSFTHCVIKEVYYPDTDPPVLDGTETWQSADSYFIPYDIQGGEGMVTLYVWLKDGAGEPVGPVSDWIVYSNATPTVDIGQVISWGHSLTISYYAQVGGEDVPAIGWVECRENGSADPWTVAGPSDYGNLQNIVTVGGLDPNTQYDLMIHADATTHGPVTYSTAGAIQISNVQTAVSDSTIMLKWETDRGALAWVTYGLPDGEMTSLPVSEELLTQHEVVIESLTAGTTYEVNLHNEDVSHSMTVFTQHTANEQSSWYWDGTENAHDADFSAEEPFNNHWLSNWPENGGVPVDNLPGPGVRWMNVKSGRVTFDWPSGVMGSRPAVTGGEMVWNSGELLANSKLQVSNDGLLTINGGIVGSWGSGPSVLEGGTITMNDGSFHTSGGPLNIPMENIANLGLLTPETKVFNMLGGAAPQGMDLRAGTVNQTAGTVSGNTTMGQHHWTFSTHVLYNFGNADGNTGTITGTGKLTVGGRNNKPLDQSTGSEMIAILRGHGVIDIATVENNRTVIADGYGTERTLDMSGVGTIDNAYDNGTFFGTGRFGWLAENKGKLTLPALSIAAGSSTVNWGEAAGDLEIDMINSMRLAFAGADGGSLGFSLLSADRSDVEGIDPAKAIGVWEADTSAFAMDGGNVSITIRYDDYLAADLQLNEEDLKVFERRASGWRDVTAGIDTETNLITTQPLTQLSQIAIATEAAAVGVEITEFTLAGRPDGTPEYTNEATVDITLTAHVADEQATITGWMVTESSEQPGLGDAGWQGTAPATYDIPGGCRTVVLYAWVKDSLDRIDGTTAAIFYDTDIPNETVVSEFTVNDGVENATEQTVSVVLTGTPVFGAQINGWMITTDDIAPPSDSPEWETSEITSWDLPAHGTYTLYGWVRDDLGTVAGTDPVTITGWSFPQILNVQAAATPTSIMLRWETDVTATCYVEYLRGETTGSTLPIAGTEHQATISDLTSTGAYTVTIHADATEEVMTVFVPASDHHYHWDGTENEYNADFSSSEPFNNHWLSNWPENGGVPVATLPGGDRREIRVRDGKAMFTWTGGRTQPRPNITGGEMEWKQGELYANNWIYVDGGTLNVTGGRVQSWGALRAKDGGHIIVNGGEISEAMMEDLGTFTINSGTVISGDGLYIPREGQQNINNVNPSRRLIYINGGNVNNNVRAYAGTVYQTGGIVNTSKDVILGSHSQWFYTRALYNLGDAEGNTGTVTGPGKLIVGGRDTYDGSKYTMQADFRGYGTVSMATIDNNRRVIADGYDTERTLDMSGATTVTNTYDNGSYFGTGQFGWFAENKGKLTLPALSIAASSSTVNWGETNDNVELETTRDEEIDLLNSMKLAFDGVNGGTLGMSLLATDRSEAAWLDPAKTIGLWEADGSAFDFGTGSVVLTIRYDEYLASDLEIVEDDLKVVVNSGGATIDATADVNTETKTITTIPLTSFSQIAVTTAEVQMAQITEFSVTGSTGSSLFTKDATIDVVLTASTLSQTGITGWFIGESEDDKPELISEDWLTEEPTDYTIAGDPGVVTLYAWVKDGEDNEAMATTTILYAPVDVVISNAAVADNGDGTATVTWDTDGLAYGKIEWQVLGETEWQSTEFAGPATSHSADMQLSGDPDDRYTIVITSNTTTLELTWPDRPDFLTAGDANFDCKVDLLDLVFVRNRLFAEIDEVSDNWQADVDQDGVIDLDDLIMVRNLLGTQCQPE